MIFENCRVPVENLIGQEGDVSLMSLAIMSIAGFSASNWYNFYLKGFKIAMKGLNGGRLNIGEIGN